MKVLVVGDRGYIGSNLVEYLVAKGIAVKRYGAKDVLDRHTLRKEADGCVLIYNCAAISGVEACSRDRERSYAVNVLGARNVVDACESVGAKPVLFSSHAVHGNTYYGALKREVELLSDRAVILRPSNIFGGNRFTELKNTVIVRFSVDNPLKVYGGTQMRDFVHISKVLEACVEAQKKPFGVYDVRSGYSITIGNLALLVSTVRGVPVVTYPPSRNCTYHCRECEFYPECADTVEAIG